MEKLSKLSPLPEAVKRRGKAKPKTLPTDQRSYLRPDEYAARAGVSRRTVDAWMKRHLIPYAKIGHVVLIDPKLADAAIGEELTRKVAQ
jgi:hypothetical protein